MGGGQGEKEIYHGRGRGVTISIWEKPSFHFLSSQRQYIIIPIPHKFTIISTTLFDWCKKHPAHLTITGSAVCSDSSTLNWAITSRYIQTYPSTSTLDDLFEHEWWWNLHVAKWENDPKFLGDGLCGYIAFAWFRMYKKIWSLKSFTSPTIQM